MNRLLELQRVSDQEPSSSTFSPTGAADSVAPPSAAAANDDDDNTTNNKGKDNKNKGKNDDDPDAPPRVRFTDDDDNKQRSSSGAAAAAAAEYVVQHDEDLDKTLKLIAAIQEGNRRVQQLTLKMRQQTAENLKNFNPTADADAGAAAIDDIMADVSRISKENKAKLDELSEETKKLTASEDLAAANAATVKIQQNQHAHLTRTFMQNINDYHSAVSENEKQLREQAVRRIKVKYTKADGTTISDEEARAMAMQVLELGQSDMLMVQSKEVLNQVLETRNDILRIERSMRELKQMMDDLSSLINEQGEIMDVVLANVQESVQFVQKGREQLAQARDHAKASSSKMRWIACCVGVIFLIILASTLGATIPVG